MREDARHTIDWPRSYQVLAYQVCQRTEQFGEWSKQNIRPGEQTDVHGKTQITTRFGICTRPWHANIGALLGSYSPSDRDEALCSCPFANLAVQISGQQLNAKEPRIDRCIALKTYLMASI